MYSDTFNHEPVHNAEMDTSLLNTMDQRQKTVEDIEIAVKNIERCLVSDDSFPELADKLKIRQGTNMPLWNQ